MVKRQHETAQSSVIGALLVLALFAGVIAYLQVSTFPRINENIEQESFEKSSTAMQQLSSDIGVATSSGVQTTSVIETQPNYPPQIIPPPTLNPTIQFPTVTDAFTLKNATQQPGWTRTTQSIRYDPQYQFYFDNPELYYEFGTSAYLDGTVSTPLTGQRIVRGKTIRIVRVESRFSAVTDANPSFGVDPQNQQFNSVSVTNTDDTNVELAVKTSLDRDSWLVLLENQRISADGYITDIAYEDNQNGKNIVSIQFAQDQRYTVKWNTVRITR